MTTYHIGKVPVPADVFAILELGPEKEGDLEYAEAKYQQLKAEWEADEHKYDGWNIDVYPGKWTTTHQILTRTSSDRVVTTQHEGYIVSVSDEHDQIMYSFSDEDREVVLAKSHELQLEYGVKYVGHWPEDNYW